MYVEDFTDLWEGKCKENSVLGAARPVGGGDKRRTRDYNIPLTLLPWSAAMRPSRRGGAGGRVSVRIVEGMHHHLEELCLLFPPPVLTNTVQKRLKANFSS